MLKGIIRSWKLRRERARYNEFGELLEITAVHKAAGVSMINGRRCLHGLDRDQQDELNEIGMAMGLDEYKKLKGII